MDNAQILYSLGRFEKAKTAYLRIIEHEPGNAAALEQLGAIALWENRLADAEYYFKQALRFIPCYKDFWPVNAQLKYRLAMTYYRQDHCAKAMAFFDEAAGAGPTVIRPFQTLDAFGQHMALFEHEEPYLIEGPPETSIPFIVTDPLPVLMVSINGSEPLCFFIDTGAAEVILDSSLADRVGATITGSFRTDYAGQKEVDIGLGKIDSMQLGEYTVRNIPVHTLNAKAMSAIFDGIEISGVIGTRLLMHFLSTIDYARGSLVLRRITSLDHGTERARITAPGAKVIPFWLIETHYIVAWGTINNKEPDLFFVDTGLGGSGFTAPLSYLRDAGIVVDWTDTQTNIGGAGEVASARFVVDRLTLGTGTDEVVEYDVPGMAMAGFVSVTGNQLGFHIGGLISHQFFRKYALTMDFTNMRLIVQPSSRVS